MLENATVLNRSIAASKCFAVTFPPLQRLRKCQKWIPWDTPWSIFRTCSRWLTSNTSTNTCKTTAWILTPCRQTWSNHLWHRPHPPGHLQLHRRWHPTSTNFTNIILSFLTRLLIPVLWPRGPPILQLQLTTWFLRPATAQVATTVASTRPASFPPTRRCRRTLCHRVTDPSNTPCTLVRWWRPRVTTGHTPT